MPYQNSPSGYLDELVALRYDLAIDLYRQRARALEVEAASRKGRLIEYWVYKAFGTNLMASLALTLNPFWQFDAELRERIHKEYSLEPLQTPVPVNRTRQFVAIYPHSITCRKKSYVYHIGTYRKWIGVSPWYIAAPSALSVDVNTDYTANIGTQSQLNGYVKDTTWKSRNPKADRIPKNKSQREALGLQSQGEFELYKPKFETPSGGLHWGGSTTTYNDLQDPNTWSYQPSYDSSVFNGGCASLDVGTATSIPSLERSYALQTLAKHSQALVGQCLPARRQFNLFYQVGELKDLPQTLRGTLTVWRDIESILGYERFAIAMRSPKFWTQEMYSLLREKLHAVGVAISPEHLSNSYLTFKFGWESMVSAILQLAKTPPRVTKEVNTLIARNGSFVTLSSSMTLPEEQWTSPPSITTYAPYGTLTDFDKPPSQTATRRIKLRCVVNSGVRLPPLDVPALREKLLMEKFGLIPRPSDIYNLIPWTWLIDWFQGLSGYLRLVEEVQGDKQLINWGLLTYISELETTATRNCYQTAVQAKHWASGNHTSANLRFDTTTTGTFKALFHLRVDVSSLANVKTTSGTRLSTTQKTILGALLSKFS